MRLDDCKFAPPQCAGQEKSLWFVGVWLHILSFPSSHRSHIYWVCPLPRFIIRYQMPFGTPFFRCIAWYLSMVPGAM